MYGRLIALVTMCCLVVGRAEALTSLPTIPLSSFPTELLPFDPGGVLDGVNVYVADTEPYATFFLEVAKVQGTMVLADSLTSMFGRALAVAAADAGEVVGSDPQQWPEIVERLGQNKDTQPNQMAELRRIANRLELMIGPVVAASEKLPGLAGQVPGLVTGAPELCPGLRNKLKLFRLMNSLRGASGQLKDAVGRMARTLDNLRAIVVAVRP